MSDIKVTSTGFKYICSECSNENLIPEDAKIGDVIECEFCGIEYRIIEIDEHGNYTLEIIEEEK